MKKRKAGWLWWLGQLPLESGVWLEVEAGLNRNRPTNPNQPVLFLICYTQSIHVYSAAEKQQFLLLFREKVSTALERNEGNGLTSWSVCCRWRLFKRRVKALVYPVLPLMAGGWVVVTQTDWVVRTLHSVPAARQLARTDQLRGRSVQWDQPRSPNPFQSPSSGWLYCQPWNICPLLLLVCI